jgi:hypothetical protein
LKVHNVDRSLNLAFCLNLNLNLVSLLGAPFGFAQDKLGAMKR